VDRYPNAAFHFVSAESVPEIDFSLVDTSTLGADRVANAAVIAAELLAPAIVLDCGTAITTEVVDAEYRFRGGAIMPGRRLLRRALKANTGQLPEIPFGDDSPPAVGVNTAEAIRAGIDLGVLGAVQRVIDASRAELGGGEGCDVYVVGGDAGFFLEHLVAVTRGAEDFTMRGLALIAGRLGLCHEHGDHAE
jgi:type III pantothenate kinase